MLLNKSKERFHENLILEWVYYANLIARRKKKVNNHPTRKGGNVYLVKHKNQVCFSLLICNID